MTSSRKVTLVPGLFGLAVFSKKEKATKQAKFLRYESVFIFIFFFGLSNAETPYLI